MTHLLLNLPPTICCLLLRPGCRRRGLDGRVSRRARSASSASETGPYCSARAVAGRLLPTVRRATAGRLRPSRVAISQLPGDSARRRRRPEFAPGGRCRQFPAYSRREAGSHTSPRAAVGSPLPNVRRTSPGGCGPLLSASPEASPLCSLLRKEHSSCRLQQKMDCVAHVCCIDAVQCIAHGCCKRFRSSE